MAGAQICLANARKQRNDRSSSGKLQSGSRQTGPGSKLERALSCQGHHLLLRSILTSPHRLRYQRTSAWPTFLESVQSASIVRVLSVGKSTPQPVAVRDRSRLRLLRRRKRRRRRRRRRRRKRKRGQSRGQGRGAPTPRRP